jgi:ATP-dependent Clp protease ATP-binding subunit ClpA
MPKDKNFKRLVRERMAKTGETYVTARAHLLSTRPSAPLDEYGYGPPFTWGIAPAVKLAHDEARLRKNLAVRPPHLLLGILDFGGAAVAALNAMKVSTAAVRADVERSITRGATTTPPTVHKETGQLLALAVEESRERGDTTVTDIALLLALASTPGPPSDALATYGASEDRLRQFFETEAADPVNEERLVARVRELLA